jgi:hypothetical protein
MLLLDGKPLSYDRAFTHEGIQYPANWLRLSSWEEKTAIGITEVPNPPYYDQRFYWGVDNPKQLEDITDEEGNTTIGLKTLWISNTKYSAGTLLAPTDWYIVRNSETGVEVPADVLERRAEIRSYCDEYEQAIEATTTTDELAAYITSVDYGSFAEVSEAPEEPVTLPAPETIAGEEGEDNIIFTGGTVSGGITSDDGIIGSAGEDTIVFSGGITSAGIAFDADIISSASDDTLILE